VPELFSQRGEGNICQGFQREGFHRGNPIHFLEHLNWSLEEKWLISKICHR